MSSNIKNPSKTLDCVGLYCPEPVFRTRVELDKLKVDEVLEVFTDDPAAEEDIKIFVLRTGQELLGLQKNGGTFRFLIKKIR
jgi:TusA-related sulfurtransferase